MTTRDGKDRSVKGKCFIIRYAHLAHLAHLARGPATHLHHRGGGRLLSAACAAPHLLEPAGRGAMRGSFWGAARSWFQLLLEQRGVVGLHPCILAFEQSRLHRSKHRG